MAPKNPVLTSSRPAVPARTTALRAPPEPAKGYRLRPKGHLAITSNLPGALVDRVDRCLTRINDDPNSPRWSRTDAIRVALSQWCDRSEGKRVEAPVALATPATSVVNPPVDEGVRSAE